MTERARCPLCDDHACVKFGNCKDPGYDRYRGLSNLERQLAAHLLEMAADKFGNHGCNDFDLSELGFTEKQAQETVVAFHHWNGDPEELQDMVEHGMNWCTAMGDFALMSWMAHRLNPDKE